MAGWFCPQWYGRGIRPQVLQVTRPMELYLARTTVLRGLILWSQGLLPRTSSNISRNLRSFMLWHVGV